MRGVVTDAFNFERIGFGITVEDPAFLCKPDRRSHTLSIRAVTLQIQIFFANELRQPVINHKQSGG
jgi:hypothetical protein